MSLADLRALAEQARTRSRAHALLEAQRRIADDRELEAALLERRSNPLDGRLLDRARVAEVDPVTLRRLVEDAQLALACGPIVAAARRFLDEQVADDPMLAADGGVLRDLFVAFREAGEVDVALEVAAARWAA